VQVDIDDQLLGLSISPPFEGPLDVPEAMVEPFYEAYYLLSQVRPMAWRSSAVRATDKLTECSYAGVLEGRVYASTQA